MLLRLLSAAWDQHRWRAPPNRASNDVPDKPEPPDPADERPVIDTGFVEDGHSSYYDPRREDVGASFWSMRMLATADTGSIGQARRRNFQTWLQAVSGLQHCRPLSGSIAADQVPYMFPLILERPEEHFDALKRAGLPIYRWDELAESDCETARYYRLHLLQLPCHQSLRPEAMKWMMSMVRHVLAGEPGPGARR